jgi:prepilin peptidase CpaA
MNPIFTLLLILILLIAMASDIRFQKIPNRLTYPAMLAALIYHTAINGGGGFIFSAEGLGLGIAIWIIPYLMGGMGAGDVKLMGVVGAFLGPEGVFIASLFTAVTGGVCAVALLILHGHLKEIIKRYGAMLKTFIFTKNLVYLPPPQGEKKPRLYYGIAITLGTLASLLLKYLEKSSYFT